MTVLVLNYCVSPEHNDYALELLEKGAKKNGRCLEDIDRPEGKAMLVDFGISKIYDLALPTTVGVRAVTPGYLPPEQYGPGTTDAQSDVYNLGATLYTLLTGRVPLESVNAMSRVAQPPPNLLSLSPLNCLLQTIIGYPRNKGII